MHTSTLRPIALCLSTMGLLACGPSGGSSTPDAGPPTYEAVAAIMMTSCAFAACHGGAGDGAAMLNLQRAIAEGTLRERLLMTSCQYDAMPLVTPGDPEQSWLYLKVAGPHMGARVAFEPSPTWEPGITPGPDGRYPPSVCPLTEGGRISFGAMMPQGSEGLDASRAATIRGWIEAGAPGPSS